MEIEEFRYPRQTFEYEYSIKDKYCCDLMHLCWSGLSSNEFDKLLKNLIQKHKIKFCPFCGQEIVIVTDRGDVG